MDYLGYPAPAPPPSPRGTPFPLLAEFKLQLHSQFLLNLLLHRLRSDLQIPFLPPCTQINPTQ